MNIVHSHQARPVDRSPEIAAVLETIAEARLREWGERISVPRHFNAEPDQNRATADWLCEVFESIGLQVERQGQFNNIVAIPAGCHDCSRRESAPNPRNGRVSGLTSAATGAGLREFLLLGAHYDSVPGCPGADDNGSAVAAMLGCAAACSQWQDRLPVMFVAFNREEDSCLGSRDFVESYLPKAEFTVRCAHILEMVGYASSAPGSQRVPTGLPIKIRDTGDFLGLLANDRSSSAADLVLRHAAAYAPELPVTGLTVKLGMESLLPVLARSDHVPFWARNLPALMWTDTADFRNPNYHQPTDTPETLDYRFLLRVTQLLTAAVIAQAVELLSQEA